MRHSKKGFTLIELLVVVAIIALLISILLPSLAKAREMSKRAVCSSNLRGMGQAMNIYANENRDMFPQAPSNLLDNGGMNAEPGYYRDCTAKGQKPWTEKSGATAEGCEKDSFPSTTADLWLLVQAAAVTPKGFLCPSTAKTEDTFGAGQTGQGSVQDPRDLYDFASTGDLNFQTSGAAGLCYGYHFGHDVNLGVAAEKGVAPECSVNLDSRFPVMADDNPYVFPKEKDFMAGSDYPTNCGANESINGNSMNHQGEGQNVMVSDSSVQFVKSPTVGIEGDNIYTRGVSWESDDSDTCGETSDSVKNVYMALGKMGKNGNLFAQTDCFILP